DREGGAGLVADLQQRRAEGVTDDQADDEPGARATLRRNLRRDVADREEQAAGEAVRNRHLIHATPHHEQHDRDGGGETEPQEDLGDRAALALARSAYERDPER